MSVSEMNDTEMLQCLSMSGNNRWAWLLIIGRHGFKM